MFHRATKCVFHDLEKKIMLATKNLTVKSFAFFFKIS